MEKSIYTGEYAVVLKLLREARERAGMTQWELAERLGLSQSFVTKMERGDRRIDIIQLRTICRILGSSLLQFAKRLERELSG
jgi:transcriptional regulator with XRE-family HTH domain